MKRLSVYCFQDTVTRRGRWWVLASSKLRARRLSDAGSTARLVKVVYPPPRALDRLVAAKYEGVYVMLDGVAREPGVALRMMVVMDKLNGIL